MTTATNLSSEEIISLSDAARKLRLFARDKPTKVGIRCLFGMAQGGRRAIHHHHQIPNGPYGIILRSRFFVAKEVITMAFSGIQSL